MEARNDLFWQRAFQQFSGLSNHTIDVAFVAFFGMLPFLCLWNQTGEVWLRDAGLGLFIAALLSGSIAFIAQTMTQTARCVANASVKKFGRAPHPFKQDKPMYARLITKAFSTSKAISRPNAVNISARNNARVSRSASRPALSSASKSSKGSSDDGNSGDSSDSGSSDSGDEPPLLTFLTNPATPYQLSTKKPHKNSLWQRILLKRPVLNCMLSVGRCPAWR